MTCTVRKKVGIETCYARMLISSEMRSKFSETHTLMYMLASAQSIYFSYHYYFKIIFQCSDRKDCCSSSTHEMSSSSGASPNSRLGFHQYFPCHPGNKTDIALEWAISSCFLHGTIILEILSIT